MRKDTVLIIDDDPSICQFIARVCTKSGYQPLVIENRDEFVSSVKNQKLFLVITDLQMPEFDGIEFMRLLAEVRTDVPVVILSGFDPRVLHTAEAFARSVGLTVVDALRKPLSIADLTAVLEVAESQATPWPESDLAAGIEKHEFALFYQPKVSFQAEDYGRVVGFEGLARWQHPKKGLVMPDKFIALAEATGQIDALTDGLMDCGLRELAHWASSGQEFSLALNLSPLMLDDSSLADRILKKVNAASVDPTRLTFEVTESGAMADPSKTMEILTRMRLKGFELSIDDFGTGYSSLVQLYDLPFSELKIDRSFVADIERQDDANVIVRTLVDLAHNLSLQACAEGVETQAEWRRLMEFGCDRMQGYLFGRPMPAEEIPAWLQSWPDRCKEMSQPTASPPTGANGRRPAMVGTARKT
jgi:EAL domain-containing protein (putative c-di-GMP-specific phosphodiesterase class I)/CheY-like chemotaxis protein